MPVTIAPTGEMKRVKINLTYGTERTIDPQTNSNIEKPYSVPTEEEGPRTPATGEEGKE